MANVPEEVLKKFSAASPEAQQRYLSKLTPDRALALQTATKKYTDSSSNNPSLLEALGLHASEGLTARHTGEIAGAAKAGGVGILDVLKGPAGVGGAIGRKLAQQVTDESAPSMVDQYREGRDATQGRIDQGAELYPTETMLAEMGGALATAPVGGVGGAIAYGAASGAGGSKADLTKGEVGEYLSDAETGGLVGGVAGKAGQVVGKGLGAAGSRISNSAAWKAFTAAHPELKDLRLITKQAAVKIGRRLLGEKAVRFGDDAENIAGRIAPLADEAGEQVGAKLRAVSDAAPDGIHPAHMADDIEESLAQRYANAADADDLKPLAEKKISNIRELADSSPELGFSEAEELVTRPFQRRGRYDQATPAATSGVYRDVGQGARRYVEKEARRQAPQQAEEWLAAKERYHELKPAQSMADEAVIREARRRGISLTDMLTVLTTMGVTGNPLAAAGTAAANHVMRTSGPATTAVSLDAMAKALGLGAQAAPALGSRIALQEEVQPDLLRQLEEQEK